MFQDQQIISRLITRYNRYFKDYFAELSGYGVHRVTARKIVGDIITYVLENRGKYRGSLEQRKKHLYHAIIQDIPYLYFVIMHYGISEKRLHEIIRDLIEMVLEEMGE